MAAPTFAVARLEHSAPPQARLESRRTGKECARYGGSGGFGRLCPRSRNSVSNSSSSPSSLPRSKSPVKILQIGNYPPPACGWAVQTKLLKQEIRRRGHACDVLNINESRKIKSAEYVDVQNGFD